MAIDDYDAVVPSMHRLCFRAVLLSWDDGRVATRLFSQHQKLYRSDCIVVTSSYCENSGHHIGFWEWLLGSRLEYRAGFVLLHYSHEADYPARS